MKKTKLFILTILLIIPISVLAISYPKVSSLNVSSDGIAINYNGIMDGKTYAVMCKLYNDNGDEIDLLSTAVEDNKFSGSFQVEEFGTYQVACANYEGGEIKKVSVTLEDNTSYTVEFNTNGADEIDSQTILRNGLVTEPVEPVKDGYRFDGWYEDETLTIPYDFNTNVVDNMTLYAGFILIPKYKVTFNTNGADKIDDIILEEGDKIHDLPVIEKEGYIFDGWCEDETLNVLFNDNKEITSDVTLYARWIEEEKNEDYTVDDEFGNSISFNREEGHDYNLLVFDYLLITDEELEELDVTREEYNSVLESLKDITKEYGSLLAFYEIEVTDEMDNAVHDGPFDIKIKLTEEMKKYNTFKMFYVNDEFSLEDQIDLTIQGDYLVGVLPHLSTYTLVGSNVSSNSVVSNNPQTLDTIYIWVSMLLLAFIGLLIGLTNMVRLNKEKR